MKILISIVLCGMLSILALGACAMKDTVESPTESNSVENKVVLVNDEIRQLIKSDDYIKASFEDKKESASALLDKLEGEGYIKGLFYDKKIIFSHSITLTAH